MSMRIILSILTLFQVVVLVRGQSAADETNSVNNLNYGSFRIIGERNMFNQNRSGRSRTFTRTRSSDRTVRTDFFALRGTMIYEKGWFAFFDGSNSDYRKAVQPAEDVAGFKVTSIGPDVVKLEGAGKQLELQVGMQMKRPQGGDWQLAAANEVIEQPPSSAATNASSESNSTTAASSEAPASGGPSDILKRLMEQREKELNAEGPKTEPKKD
jgi:hypothetical protein